jgi:N-methylhydantoinase A
MVTKDRAFSRRRRFVLGVDIGGTFTDFVGCASGGNRLFVHKLLTTHHDLTAAVFEGIAAFAAHERIGPEDSLSVVHATTLATNLILERKGAKVALVATRGFRDILEMRRETRYDDYDLELSFPDPLVPRSLCLEITERTLATGEVVAEPRESETAEIVGTIERDGIEAVAVCLLHAYANPANELRVRDLLTRAGCRVPISLSSLVQPEIREYDRCSTTVVNAYVQPAIVRYICRFKELLDRQPYTTELLIMQSNGGYADAETSAEFPARLVESGPAAGAILAAHLSAETKARRTIAFDMGGTTAKITVIRDFTPEIAPGLEVARVHRQKKGSGIPLRCPSVELLEIGSGGGSIALIDRIGRLRVGPHSAGSDPGPACYGRGGMDATVTDADLVLGYIDAARFPFPLDVEKAREAIRRNVAEPLGLEEMAAAAGIVDVVTEQMASASRIHLLEKGLDAREFSLVAFGGAGPVHAHLMARRLGIRSIVYPLAAGVASALGLLAAPGGGTATRTMIGRLDEFDPARLERAIADLRAETRRQMHLSGDAAGSLEETLVLEMRYARQGYEIPVVLPSADTEALDKNRIRDLFQATYEKVFGRIVERVPIEIVNLRLFARSAPIGNLGRRPITPEAERVGQTSEAAIRRRPVYFKEAGGFIPCDVVPRGVLELRGAGAGPLAIEDRETTIIVPPGSTARLDEFGHVVVELI